MHRKKHSICSVWYYPGFQTSAGDLGMHPPQIREGGTIILFKSCHLKLMYFKETYTPKPSFLGMKGQQFQGEGCL